MTKIAKFDRKTCKSLGDEIEAALAAVAERHGLTIRYAGGSLDDVSFTAKVVCKTANPEILATKERDDFALYCRAFDLKPSDYGKTFTANGKAYRLVGFAVNRPKFPIRAAEVATGKVTLFTEVVIDRIKASAA